MYEVKQNHLLMDLQMIGLGILKISTEIYFLCKTKKGLLMDVANKLE